MLSFMEEKKKTYCTYILLCKDGSLYTGYTPDMANRLKKHNEGTASKYTRARLPANLVYCEVFDTKGEAMSRECAIKRMTRAQKQALIAKTPSL